jgi:hypothetical protein
MKSSSAESVASSTLGARYAQAPAPVVPWRRAWDDHGLASVEPNSTTTASLYVEDPAHPVASGLEGTVTVASAAQKVGYASGSQLGPDAQREVVAVDEANTGRNVAFAYEAGARTVAGTAPARRVGLGLYSAALAASPPTAGRWSTTRWPGRSPPRG